MLAPAGENQFKVWQDSDTAAAADIFQGQNSGLLPIFLYESSIKAIEEKEQKTVLSVINLSLVLYQRWPRNAASVFLGL